MNVKLSKHAVHRSSQRGIPLGVAQLIFDLGEINFAHGSATKLSLGRKDVERLEKTLRGILKKIERGRNRALVVSSDGTVITLY